jgi:cellulose synthase/poly-beta-1,6-N-acetylglucosamine synthase-like glycosyltransferase
MINAFRIAHVEYELLILAPDEETINAAKQYKDIDMKIRILQDPGLGKPKALNIAFKEAKGDIMILTDGDTYISRFAIRELLKKMKDPKVGAVSGRPISIDPKDNMFGYFGHLLSDMADKTRLKNKDFIVSGYLYALRKGIIEEMPENTLSDDAYNSFKLIEKGWKIDYCSNAHVFIKYPTNFSDWIKQKKRSGGGYVQLTSEFKMKPPKATRSFTQELKGLWDVIAYPKNQREVAWTLALIGVRAYMWAMIFWERKVTHKDFNKTWTRIESTK